MAGIDQLLKAAQLGQTIGAPIGQYFRDQRNREQDLTDREEARKQRLEDRDFQVGRQEDLARRDLMLKAAMGQLGGIVTPELQGMRDTAYNEGGIPKPSVYDVGGGVKIDPNLAQQFESEKRKQELSDIIARAGGIEEAKQRAAQPFELEKLGARLAGEGRSIPRNTIVPPGATVVDAQGNIVFKADEKNAEPKTMSVAPGNTVIDSTGNVIFNNPITASTRVKPLESTQKENLSQAQNAFQTLESLQQAYKDNPSATGSTILQAGAINRLLSPYQVQNADKALSKSAQEVGRFFEGGKLSDADVLRYKQTILPQYSDNTGVTATTFNNLKQGIAKKYLAEVETNKNAGSDTSEIEQSPFYKKMSQIASGSTSEKNSSETSSQSNEDAVRWLLDNPNDKRAPAIRKKLGL